jgi:hypothetical protein
MGLVAINPIDELVAAIRRLPVEARLRLIERVAHDVAEDTPKPPAVAAERAAGPSLLGLFADEPDLVDRICALAYEDRAKAEPRAVDE